MFVLLFITQALADTNCFYGGDGSAFVTGVATYPVGIGATSGVVGMGSNPQKGLMSMFFGAAASGSNSKAGWKTTKLNSTANQIIVWSSEPKQDCVHGFVDPIYTKDFRMCVGPSCMFETRLGDYKIAPGNVVQRWQQAGAGSVLATVVASVGVYPVSLYLPDTPLGSEQASSVLISVTGGSSGAPPDDFFAVPSFCS